MNLIEAVFSGISIAVFTWLIVIERRLSRLESKFDLILNVMTKCNMMRDNYE